MSESLLPAGTTTRPVDESAVWTADGLPSEGELLDPGFAAPAIRRSFQLGLRIASIINAHPALGPELYPLLEETDALIRDLRTMFVTADRASLPRRRPRDPGRSTVDR